MCGNGAKIGLEATVRLKLTQQDLTQELINLFEVEARIMAHQTIVSLVVITVILQQIITMMQVASCAS